MIRKQKRYTQLNDVNDIILRSRYHQDAAEKLLHGLGIGHKQLERVLTQSIAHATLANSYLLELSVLTARGSSRSRLVNNTVPSKQL